jgi:hypothetical protein
MPRLHIRAGFSDKPSSTATSWLAVYPPLPSQAKSVPVLPDAMALLHIEKVVEMLDDIKDAIMVREYYLNIYANNKDYCSICTPQNLKAGSCDQACTLLRPLNKTGIFSQITERWIKSAMKSVKLYYRLRREVGTAKSRLTDWVVLAKLKHEVEKLRKDTLNHSEKHEEMDWPDIVENQWDEVGGAKTNWTFESAWGKGPHIAEEVAPDEAC